MKEGGLDNRSAGACPPRAHDPRENCTPTKAVPRADRGTARDRPSPYDKGEAASTTVARGPVPRDLPVDRSMARDRPSPYEEGEAPLTTVAGGAVPRERTTRAKTARRPRPFLVPIEAWRGTGPRPTVKGRRYFFRSAGACPPRSLNCADDIETRRSLLRDCIGLAPSVVCDRLIAKRTSLTLDTDS